EHLQLEAYSRRAETLGGLRFGIAVGSFCVFGLMCDGRATTCLASFCTDQFSRTTGFQPVPKRFSSPRWVRFAQSHSRELFGFQRAPSSRTTKSIPPYYCPLARIFARWRNIRQDFVE